LADQVSRLGDVTREILDGVGTVVNRFESQTQSLTEATRNLSEVNKQIETTVEERRPALESLTAGLRARSEELDGMMRSFTRIISETLKTAEERATAVSRLLTENTSSATKGIIDNFESMNRTASTEGKKAADSVREANRQLIEEITEAVAEATRRFADATSEMRDSTTKIQKELDETRDHIKRGVLELPEETRQNADAMRRVVSDQIQALGALSEIITRHGKTLDLSSPALGEPRNIEARSVEPVAAAVGDDSGGWSGGEAPRPAQARARAPANGGKREPRPAPAPSRADAPAAKSTARPAVSRSSAAAPADGEDERGWSSR
jgi:methyl-accepting chemotaxis protein